MSRMFRSITQTWNPLTGCCFGCSYCWARKLVEGRLKNTPKYAKCGFAPTFHPKALATNFKKGSFVFVSDLGDIAWAALDDFKRILTRIEVQPEVKFLLQTKSPQIFLEPIRKCPHNVYFGTTIETNRNHNFSKAPLPFIRYREICRAEHPLKFLSIEPIMDFDVEILIGWVKDIHPKIVEIGADNYNHNLPEPPWEKVTELIRKLQENGLLVRQKEGLERLAPVGLKEREMK